MSNSNKMTKITESEAAESLLSLIYATSNVQQSPVENASKDQPAALKRGQEKTNESIVVNQVSPNHGIQPDEPIPPSPPRSHFQVECKILNMSILKLPSRIPSRVIFQSNQADEASSIESIACSSRRNRAIEDGNVFPISKKGSAITTTPEVLMHLLLDPENYSAMHFLSNGDAFVICNVKEFLKSLRMKKYFRLTNFGSFIGKLQRWGFTHTSEGLDPELHVFRHPLFRKDDPESLKKMKYCPHSSKGANGSTFPYLGTNSRRSQRGSSPTRIDSAPFQSIQDTINRHLELSTMYSEIQRNQQDFSQRASPIVVASAVKTKIIVDAAIACLQGDESMPECAINPIRYSMRHLSSNPYSKYTVAHRESAFNHRMMLNHLQSLNGDNSCILQNPNS